MFYCQHYFIIIASEFGHYFVLQLIMENIMFQAFQFWSNSNHDKLCFSKVTMFLVHLNGFNAIMFLFGLEILLKTLACKVLKYLKFQIL